MSTTSISSSSLSSPTPPTYGFALAVDGKNVDRETKLALGYATSGLAVVDDPAISLLKARIQGSIGARIKQNEDIARARVDPMWAVNERLTKEREAAVAAVKTTSKMIDDLVAAGRPSHEIEAIAGRLAGALSSVGEAAVDMAAPADLSRVAWKASDTGDSQPAPGASSVRRAPAKRRAPKRKSNRRK